MYMFLYTFAHDIYCREDVTERLLVRRKCASGDARKNAQEHRELLSRYYNARFKNQG